jgi:Fur family ferric uptake transcriptional regulator
LSNLERHADNDEAPVSRRLAALRPGRHRGMSEPTLRAALSPTSTQKDPGALSIERLCVKHGLKMTGQRRLIARVLSAATDHPSVEELYRRARQLDGRISIATVYRTARLLEENGILDRRDFGGGRARYEPNDHGQHHHLIDVETGNVTEFSNAEHERLIRTIAEQLGFDLVSLRLQLFGKRRVPARPPRPVKQKHHFDGRR